MSTITSLKDLGYKQAQTGDNLDNQAEYALVHIAGFPEDIPSEAREMLYEGYRLRHSEKHPAKVYAVVNDHYILATPEQIKNAKVEKVEMGVAYAFAYSSQEFGKLKNTNPALHGIIKVIIWPHLHLIKARRRCVCINYPRPKHRLRSIKVLVEYKT